MYTYKSSKAFRLINSPLLLIRYNLSLFDTKLLHSLSSIAITLDIVLLNSLNVYFLPSGERVILVKLLVLAPIRPAT